MKHAGAARRLVICALAPTDREIIDVGADHGHVAHALGAIATERLPHRSGRPDVPWVVADGLAPFRTVPAAVIAGMGAKTIAGILERGPRPEVLVAHAPDDPPTLRLWLAAHGWRIEAEALAREGNRFAEVLRAVPGDEPSGDLWLELGPRLLRGDDPLLRPFLVHSQGFYAGIASATAGAAPDKHAWATARADFLGERLLERGWVTGSR